jgi:hypothetical protein
VKPFPPREKLERLNPMLRRTPEISFIDLRKRSLISLPFVEIVDQKGRVFNLP